MFAIVQEPVYFTLVSVDYSVIVTLIKVFSPRVFYYMELNGTASFDVCRTVTAPQSSTAAFRGALLAIRLGAVCAGQSVSQADHPQGDKRRCINIHFKAQSVIRGLFSASGSARGCPPGGASPNTFHQQQAAAKPQTPGMGDGK